MNFHQSDMLSNHETQQIANHMAMKMPSANMNHSNPIETLSLGDLNYLISYLNVIKSEKINKDIKSQPNIPINRANDIYNPLDREVPVDWRTHSSSNPYNTPNGITEGATNQEIIPGSRGSEFTRTGKRSQQQNLNLGYTNDYHNPYEYGAKQNSLGQINKQPYHGQYYNDPLVVREMGLASDNRQTKPTDHIRNVNVESSLLQREMTHLPGQRRIVERENDRFELLPFDPQDHRHIVWSDSMPRGGYSTRTDRLEL